MQRMHALGCTFDFPETTQTMLEEKSVELRSARLVSEIRRASLCFIFWPSRRASHYSTYKLPG